MDDWSQQWSPFPSGHGPQREHSGNRGQRGGEDHGHAGPDEGGAVAVDFFPDVDEGIVDTTVGRVLFNMILPKELRFKNDVMDKKKLGGLIDACYRQSGEKETVLLADHLRTELVLDALNMEWQYIRLNRDPGCSVCGG